MIPGITWEAFLARYNNGPPCGGIGLAGLFTIIGENPLRPDGIHLRAIKVPAKLASLDWVSPPVFRFQNWPNQSSNYLREREQEKGGLVLKF